MGKQFCVIFSKVNKRSPFVPTQEPYKHVHRHKNNRTSEEYLDALKINFKKAVIYFKRNET